MLEIDLKNIDIFCLNKNITVTPKNYVKNITRTFQEVLLLKTND